MVILIDAVCVRAVISLDDLLSQLLAQNKAYLPLSKCRAVFTHYAKSQDFTAFSHPNLASVQACLLLADTKCGYSQIVPKIFLTITREIESFLEFPKMESN